MRKVLALMVVLAALVSFGGSALANGNGGITPFRISSSR